MLPNFLHSSYKTYKEDTNTIATWLAATAKRCGYPEDLLDHKDGYSQSGASKRLKGNARKKAKSAAATKLPTVDVSKLSATPPQGPKYILKVEEFITLAEYVAVFNKSIVKVPASLVSALNRAIDLRKEHHEYSRGRNPADQLNGVDEGHSYFVGVLERTREILMPRMPSDSIKDFVTKPNRDSESQTASELSNSFADLDVQELSQDFINAPDVSPAARVEVQPRYEAEPLDSLEEQYFAAHCLFQDVKKIRAFLRQLWTSYLEGMDIVAISVTTNTAIDFVRSLEQDYLRQFPGQSDFEGIVKLFYGAQCLNRGQDPSSTRPGEPFNFAVYDLAEECLLSTYVILSSVQDVISPGSLPVYKPGHFGTRDMSSDWFDKSSREKFQDDKVVLLEAFPDLMLMTMITEKSPLAEDELIRGFRGMGPGKDIPLWLVFAAQCFLDAQHVLKEDICRPHAQLMTVAKSISSSIETNLNFHQSLRVDTWPRSNDKVLQEQLRVIDEWVRRDVVAEKLKKIQRNMPVPDPEPFRLLKQYPLLCGLFIFALKMRFQESGITFANAWGSIMYCGHLYNAARQEKLLSKCWKDMELLMMLQSPERFFVGDRPKALQDYLKRFLLSMGYSATAFASNRRRNAPIASSRGPRGLSELCKVGTLFTGRYCDNDHNVAWTSDSLTPILESMLTTDENESEEEPGEKAKTKAKKSTLSRSKTKKVKESSTGSLIKGAKNYMSSGMPTVDFLELLGNALHAEALELTIDYLSIHRSCWMLLRAVNGACKPKILELYGAGYLEKENQLPFVVGYIFMTATTTSRVANVLLPRRGEVVVSSQLLATAAKQIEEMIDTGAGGIELQLLERFQGYEIDLSALDDEEIVEHNVEDTL